MIWVRGFIYIYIVYNPSISYIYSRCTQQRKVLIGKPLKTKDVFKIQLQVLSHS